MWIALIATCLCVLITINVHFLSLRFFWRSARPRLAQLPGNGIAALVIGCIVVHCVEIAVFAIGLFVAAVWEDATKLALSGWNHENLNLWYYSAAFYTSLGADQPPTAGLRVFATSEALTGLILITWTASFVFLLMQDSWES